MKSAAAWISPVVALAAIGLVGSAHAAGTRYSAADTSYETLAGVGLDGVSFTEGFNGTTLPAGWVATNLSIRPGNPWGVAVGITDSTGAVVVPPFEGTGFAVANYTSIVSGAGTISNWLISPLITGIANGDTFSFYTTTTPASAYPDRLELRLSTSGSSTDVGATQTSVGVFTTTLISVNPTLAAGVYPQSWTQVTGTVSGLAAPLDGRVALRYFVTGGGPGGANSNIIGVDSFSYTAAVPEPASWAMALAGIAGLAGLRRFGKKS